MNTAYDMSHVKSVKVVCLLDKSGHLAGKIVANYSDNPNGSVCTATFSIWKGELANQPKITTKAAGYGYDKFSSCVEQFLPNHKSVSNWQTAVESYGYIVHELL